MLRFRFIGHELKIKWPRHFMFAIELTDKCFDIGHSIGIHNWRTKQKSNGIGIGYVGITLRLNKWFAAKIVSSLHSIIKEQSEQHFERSIDLHAFFYLIITDNSMPITEFHTDNGCQCEHLLFASLQFLWPMFCFNFLWQRNNDNIRNSAIKIEPFENNTNRVKVDSEYHFKFD